LAALNEGVMSLMDIRIISRILAVSGALFLLAACGSDGDGDSRVVVSTGDTIIPINDLQYSLPLVVQVSGDGGSPQANARVDLEVRTLGYLKGKYAFVSDPIAEWVQFDVAFCDAEDANDNGVLDAGEDANNNGLLDPDIPTITEHPDETPTLIAGTSTLTTDENGFGYFSLTYPKSEASWVFVQLVAKAQGGREENKDVMEFFLSVSIEDLQAEDDAPAFVVSPYGTAPNCSDPF
jgi:hypothetical protein